MTRVVRALDEAGIDLEDVAVHQPSLDDVFLRLTGAPPAVPAIDQEAAKLAGRGGNTDDQRRFPLTLAERPIATGPAWPGRCTTSTWSRSAT